MTFILSLFVCQLWHTVGSLLSHFACFLFFLTFNFLALQFFCFSVLWSSWGFLRTLALPLTGHCLFYGLLGELFQTEKGLPGNGFSIFPWWWCISTQCLGFPIGIFSEGCSFLTWCSGSSPTLISKHWDQIWAGCSFSCKFDATAISECWRCPSQICCHLSMVSSSCLGRWPASSSFPDVTGNLDFLSSSLGQDIVSLPWAVGFFQILSVFFSTSETVPGSLCYLFFKSWASWWKLGMSMSLTYHSKHYVRQSCLQWEKSRELLTSARTSDSQSLVPTSFPSITPP